jgi:hypothetical protein
MRQHQPGSRTNRRERKSFDEQLRQDAEAARAERRSDGDLTEPSHRARIHENRQVHGDDERKRAGEQQRDPQ